MIVRKGKGGRWMLKGDCQHPEERKAQAEDHLLYATVLGSFYCFAGLCAILYPGTNWTDLPRGLGPDAQKYVFAAIIGIQWLGYLFETARLRKAKKT